MKNILLTCLLACLFIKTSAQLADGTYAPNFSYTTLTGTTGSLNGLLAQQKTVILFFITSWDPNSYTYLQSGVLQELYATYGPNGTCSQNLEILMIESDEGTAQSELYGFGANSQGDFVALSPFPILSPATTAILDSYSGFYFPMLYVICPDHLTTLTNQGSVDYYSEFLFECNYQNDASIKAGEGDVVCTTQFTPTAILSNISLPSLTSATVSYSLDGGSIITSNWTGNLSAGSSAEVTFPMITITETEHTIHYTLESPNGVNTDVGLNNCNTRVFQVESAASLPIPYFENVSNVSFPYNNWHLYNPDNLDTWERSTVNGGSLFMDNFNYSAANPLDGVMIPPLDISSIPNPKLSFKVAYVPYNSALFDGLGVEVSNDCGVTWTTVYFKEGATLGTVGGVSSSFFVPTANQWRTECISLSQFSGSEKLFIRFVGHNGYGNSLYVDDIKVDALCFGETVVNGCIFPDACNYNPNANTDNGSCYYPTSPCNDNDPSTINDVYNSECQCVGTYVDPGCPNFNFSEFTFEPSCSNSADGIVGVDVIGTSSPYSYVWTNNPSNGPLIENTAAGVYSVTITDNTGCSEEAIIELTAPPVLNVQVVTSNVHCVDGSDGSASAVASGGTSPYSYNWNTTPVSSNQTISNLVAGSYGVTVIDDNGCSQSENVIITEPTIPLSVSIVGNNADCASNNGSATAQVTGNTSSITYLWSNNSTSSTISNLSAGNYSVVVTSGLCQASATVTINNNSAPNLTLLSNDLTCFGSNDGIITAIVSGGQSPINVYWSNGLTGLSNSDLAAGEYTILVVDGDGCQIQETAVLEQPLPISTSYSMTPDGCNGLPLGAIDITVSGGNPPYQYEWSNGSSNEDATGLDQGNYSVIITDGNNCSASNSYQVSTPNSPSVSYTSENVTCFGGDNGSAEISVSGGTPPYAYNWTNGSSQPLLQNLIAGDYSCLVTDAAGCTDEVIITIDQPQGSTPQIFGAPTADEFELLTYTVSTQQNVNYVWSITGGNLVSGQGTNIIQVQWGSGPATGIVVVTETDETGCSVTSQYTVDVGFSAVLENGNALDIVLFPSPADEKIFLKISPSLMNDSYFIYNSQGQQISSGKFYSTNQEFNTSNWKSGMYTIITSTEEKRFIIVH